MFNWKYYLNTLDVSKPRIQKTNSEMIKLIETNQLNETKPTDARNGRNLINLKIIEKFIWLGYELSIQGRYTNRVRKNLFTVGWPRTKWTYRLSQEQVKKVGIKRKWGPGLPGVLRGARELGVASIIDNTFKHKILDPSPVYASSEQNEGFKTCQPLMPMPLLRKRVRWWKHSSKSL